MEIREPGFFSRGKVILPPSPQVTVDALQDDLTRNFAQSRGYEVYKTALIGADLVVKRSGWTGVALKLQQSGSNTTILFNPLAPSALVRVLMMGLITLLILYFGAWKDMTAEFKEYARKSPLLNR